MPTIHTLIAPLRDNDNDNDHNHDHDNDDDKPERFYSINVWQ